MPDQFRIKVELKGGGVVIFDHAKLQVALRQSGQEVAQLARSMIRSSVGGGRYYSTRRAGAIIGYQASAPGQPPASRTGALASSITVRRMRRRDGVSVVSSQYYSRFLETGARGGGPGRRSRVTRRGGVRHAYANSIRVMEPRPFMSAALEARRAGIEARIKDAAIEGVDWKEIPMR